MLKILVWKRSGTGANIKRRLCIPSDSTITFKLSNPLVSEVGLFSYPLTVPYEENKHVFNFPAEGNAVYDDFAFEMFVGVERFIEGDVEITNASAIEVYFKSGSSSVASLLRETYMDENINGASWGSFANYAQYISQKAVVIDGKYPQYNFAAPVIKTPEAVQQYICFYLRFLLRKLIGNLNYVIDKDQSSIVEDMNRVFLFTNRRWTPRFSVIPYSDFLPHIKISDFLKEVQQRFNLFIYFSPFATKASVLHFDKVFSEDVVDWTHKFISDEDYEKYDLRNIYFENEGDDDDILTNSEVDDSWYQASIDDSKDLEFLASPVADEYVIKLTSNNRIYKGTRHSPSQSFDEKYYLRTSTSSGWKEIIQGYPAAYSEAATNIETVSQTLNLIQKFVLPEFTGTVNEIILLNVWAKKNQPGDYRLIAILYESTDEDAEILAFFECKIEDLEESVRSLPLLLNRSIDLEGGKLALKLFEYHPSGVVAGTVTIEYGGFIYGTGVDKRSLVTIDGWWFKFREYGLIGNFELNAGVNKETYKNETSGLILINTIDRFNQLTFSMPESDKDQEKQSEDYAWSIYRGLIDNELFTHESVSSGFPTRAPFACYDDKNEYYSDYQQRLTYSDVPTLSLRWTGENGLINRCFQTTVPWRRHFARRVIKKLNLSISDIIGSQLYKPVMIGSQKYIISELSIPIGANGDIGEVTAELLTM